MRDTERHDASRTIGNMSAAAAQARLCAAARAGDPLAVEIAGRAYAGAVHRALLIRFARFLRDMLRPDPRQMSSPQAAPARLGDFEP